MVTERKEAELKAKDKTIVSYETELADVSQIFQVMHRIFMMKMEI